MPAQAVSTLSVGDLVHIDIRKKEYNGQPGKVHSLKAKGKKYEIHLTETGELKTIDAVNVKLRFSASTKDANEALPAEAAKATASEDAASSGDANKGRGTSTKAAASGSCQFVCAHIGPRRFEGR